MDAQDLAFYLATNGIDATPKGNYVEVYMGGDIYKLTPPTARLRGWPALRPECVIGVPA